VGEGVSIGAEYRVAPASGYTARVAQSFLGGIADRIVLVCGTVAGGCVPGFLAQYRQRVGGMLDQVLADIAPFQDIANRYHGGSLDELVRYHLASSDATFHAEGAALQAMITSEATLRQMHDSLQGGIWHQLAWLTAHPDSQILHAAWQDYIPSLTLDAQGISIALVIGGCLWLAFLTTQWGVAKSIRALMSKSRPARIARQSKTNPEIIDPNTHSL
jgi:hypothetical protein